MKINVEMDSNFPVQTTMHTLTILILCLLYKRQNTKYCHNESDALEKHLIKTNESNNSFILFWN